MGIKLLDVCPPCHDNGKEVQLEDVSRSVRDNIRIVCPECQFEYQVPKSGKNDKIPEVTHTR